MSLFFLTLLFTANISQSEKTNSIVVSNSETKVTHLKTDTPFIESNETKVITCYDWSEVEKKVRKDLYKILDTMPVFNLQCDSLDLSELNECNYYAITKEVSKIENRSNQIDSLIKMYPDWIYFSFIVEKNCFISNIKIKRGESNILNNIVETNLKKLNGFFKPGIKNGKKVSVEYILRTKLR